MSTQGVDRRELSRLIALSFSAGELSKYAERWRVFTDREGSSDDGARVLVRALDGRDKLPQLIESLKSHKPLVEWPEWVDPEPEHEAAPASDEAPTSLTEVMDSPELEEPPREPIVDPFLGGDEDSVDDDDDEPSRKPMLIMTAIGVGGIAIGGLGVWLITRGDAGPQAGMTTLASVASDELRRSVTSIREACEVDGLDESARRILTRAFDSCSVPEISPGKAPRIDLRPRSKPQPRGRLVQPRVRQPARAPECLDRCHALYSACTDSKCGAEPTSASDFESYQRCKQGCMTAYSRCRLSCR